MGAKREPLIVEVPTVLSRMFPKCIGTTRLAPTNRQCARCERYGQQCDWRGTHEDGGGE